jgi:K+-sensing histidine kinase KdpD
VTSTVTFVNTDSRASQPDVSSEVAVAWPDVVRFVRQLSHDLRNNLNAMELQAAFVGELVEDAEAQSEVKRLRAMASELGATLQNVTAAMAPISLHSMPYKAAEFIEDLQQKIEKELPTESGKIKWEIEAGKGMLDIDPQLLQHAFVELFTNASRHGRSEDSMVAEVKNDDEKLVFKLREPKKSFAGSTEQWGQRPLQKLGHGHYGLGLYRARAILEAHGGSLKAQYDPPDSTLTTTVTLPVATSSG